jgi:hypothetical protein
VRVHGQRLPAALGEAVAEVHDERVADLRVERGARDRRRRERGGEALGHLLVDEGAVDARPGDGAAVPLVAPRPRRDDVPERLARLDPVLARPPSGLGLRRGELQLLGRRGGRAEARRRHAARRRIGPGGVARLAQQDALAADRAQERARSCGEEAAAW